MSDEERKQREADQYMKELGLKPKGGSGGTRAKAFKSHPDGSRTLPGSKYHYYTLSVPRWLFIEIEYRSKKANQHKSEWLAEQLCIKKPD